MSIQCSRLSKAKRNRSDDSIISMIRIILTSERSRAKWYQHKFVRSVIPEREENTFSCSLIRDDVPTGFFLAFDGPVITSHDTLTVDPAVDRSSSDSRCSTNRAITMKLQRETEKRTKLTVAFIWNPRRVSKHKYLNL